MYSFTREAISEFVAIDGVLRAQRHQYVRLSEIMEIREIRVLMKYEFHLGATTRQAVANINSVFGVQMNTNATVAR
ncbi:hypothetical protein NPIL_64771 [Nephila pilipes]|uniref:Uncharacterized protein n=1 Tax=Nephila pilipes TaxID=299642 RepID=A0A8X6I2W1_NEPPI|nr:hypothetical protein NPIL_64771 [Nephila pilipes]